MTSLGTIGDERIRFQADANFSRWIVKGLLRRHPAMDIQSAEAADLRGLPDPEVLARAAAEGRALLTHDYHTMPQHFGDFLAGGSHSPGVFLLHQNLPIGQAIDLIELIWQASMPEDWTDAFTYLP